MPYRVKGSTLSSKLEWVRERLGVDAVDSVRHDVPALPVPLLETSWVTYEIYVELLQAIVRRFFDGEPRRLRELGVDSARRALEGTYKVFAEGGDFVAFLDRIARMHASLYSDGEMTVELGHARHSCAFILSGAPAYEVVDMEVAAGFYTGAAEVLGTELTDCEWSREGASVHFSLRWR